MTFSDIYKENTNSGIGSFLSAVREIVQDHTETLGSPIFGLDDEQKQALIDRINPYLLFELNQSAETKGTTVEVRGTGIMYISTPEGTTLGVEHISRGDIVTGVIDDVCVYPVPTSECLILAGNGEIPIVDETLSGVIMLKDTCYKTGLNKTGEFELEHDLAEFQIGLPLAHYLQIEEAHS